MRLICGSDSLSIILASRNQSRFSWSWGPIGMKIKPRESRHESPSIFRTYSTWRCGCGVDVNCSNTISWLVKFIRGLSETWHSLTITSHMQQGRLARHGKSLKTFLTNERGFSIERYEQSRLSEQSDFFWEKHKPFLYVDMPDSCTALTLTLTLSRPGPGLHIRLKLCQYRDISSYLPSITSNFCNMRMMRYSDLVKVYCCLI